MIQKLYCSKIAGVVASAATELCGSTTDLGTTLNLSILPKYASVTVNVLFVAPEIATYAPPVPVLAYH